MGGPDEAGGDGGVAFVVDAEAAVVDEPGPGTFDDPATREHFEGVSVGPADDLGIDAQAAAEPGESDFEPGVAPHLREAVGLEAGVADGVDAAPVVRRTGRYHDHRYQQPQGVHDAEGLATGDLLAGVIPPGRTAHGGGALGTAGVHDPP